VSDLGATMRDLHCHKVRLIITDMSAQVNYNKVSYNNNSSRSNNNNKQTCYS